MLIAITGGMGICNIHMVPPIYPIIKCEGTRSHSSFLTHNSVSLPHVYL